MKSNKRYLVMIQDEWNNLYYIGEYTNLENAIPDVNEWLTAYDTQIDELTEYVSTFGSCFDKEIETGDDTVIMVRGFVLEGNDK